MHTNKEFTSSPVKSKTHDSRFYQTAHTDRKYCMKHANFTRWSRLACQVWNMQKQILPEGPQWHLKSETNKHVFDQMVHTGMPDLKNANVDLPGGSTSKPGQKHATVDFIRRSTLVCWIWNVQMHISADGLQWHIISETHINVDFTRWSTTTR